MSERQTPNILPKNQECSDTTIRIDDPETAGSTFMGLQNNPLTDLPPPPPASDRPSGASPEQSVLIDPSIDSSAPSEPVPLGVPHTENQPKFRSALSYTEVRDYAYPEYHPLHYGVPQAENRPSSEDYESEEYPDSYMRDGGPPWKEDPDLASPVIISHSVGDRISREYEFSVASEDEIHGRAVALFDFVPENDNEAPLKEGQIIWVSYRHGQGWLVAEDPATGETGLVPEEYVQLITSEHGYTSSQSSAGIGYVEDPQRQLEQLNGHYSAAQEQQIGSMPPVPERTESGESWVEEGLISEDDQPTSTDASVDTSRRPSSIGNTKQNKDTTGSDTKDDPVIDLVESLGSSKW